jgi:hypothetical protein
MPTICSFYGILIRLFFNDHAPPHFHARYGEFEATIDIDTLTCWKTNYEVALWLCSTNGGTIHKAELVENWRLCREKAQPGKIEPLV